MYILNMWVEKYLERALNMKAYKMILRQVRLYGSETWTLAQMDEHCLGIWEAECASHHMLDRRVQGQHMGKAL